MTYKDIVKDYLDNSTIHGCKYVIKDNLNLLEKILWVIIIITFYFFGGDLVYYAFKVNWIRPVV